jgi:hypothetical protein
MIARFANGGAHAGDPAALTAERRRLRLRYVSPFALRVGCRARLAAAAFAPVARSFGLIISGPEAA